MIPAHCLLKLPLARACVEAIGVLRPTLKTALDALDTAAALDAKDAARTTAAPPGNLTTQSTPAAATDGGDAASSGAPGVESTALSTALPIADAAEPMGAPRGYARVQALWECCRAATDGAVELGAALYPPLEKSDVRVSIHQLVESMPFLLP